MKTCKRRLLHYRYYSHNTDSYTGAFFSMAPKLTARQRAVQLHEAGRSKQEVAAEMKAEGYTGSSICQVSREWPPKLSKRAANFSFAVAAAVEDLRSKRIPGNPGEPREVAEGFVLVKPRI